MLGEEGCEQLQEVLEGFNMAAVLASLRWGVWGPGFFVPPFIHSENMGGVPVMCRALCWALRDRRRDSQGF